MRLTKSSMARPGLRSRGPADHQWRMDAEVVQVALAAGHATHAVVAREDHHGIVERFGLLEFFEENADHEVDREHLAEIVREVGTHLGHIGEGGGHFAAQRVGIEAPKLHPRAARPGAVHVGGAEDVEKRRARLALGEQAADIVAHPFFDGRKVLARLRARLNAAAVAFAAGPAGVEGLVRGPYEVAALFEEASGPRQPVAGVRLSFPGAAAEVGRPPRTPEVAAGGDRGTAGGTGWRADESVRKQNALVRHAVDVGGLDDVVGAGTPRVAVGAGGAPPVVADEKQDVRAGGRRQRCGKCSFQVLSAVHARPPITGKRICRIRNPHLAPRGRLPCGAP